MTCQFRGTSRYQSSVSREIVSIIDLIVLLHSLQHLVFLRSHSTKYWPTSVIEQNTIVSIWYSSNQQIQCNMTVTNRLINWYSHLWVESILFFIYIVTIFVPLIFVLTTCSYVQQLSARNKYAADWVQIPAKAICIQFVLVHVGKIWIPWKYLIMSMIQ